MRSDKEKAKQMLMAAHYTEEDADQLADASTAMAKAGEILGRCDHKWIPVQGTHDVLCVNCQRKWSAGDLPDWEPLIPAAAPLVQEAAAPIMRDQETVPVYVGDGHHVDVPMEKIREQINKNLFASMGISPMALGANVDKKA